MIYCTTCGAAKEDSSVCCCACGSELPVPVTTSNTTTKSAKSGKPIVWIAIIGVIAACVIVGGIALTKLFSPAGTLQSALKSTMGNFDDQLQEQSNLSAFTDKMNKLTDDGDYTVKLEIIDSVSSVVMDMDYSRSDKIMAGQLSYNHSLDGVALALDYSIDKSSVQLALPEQSLNVYGFSLKEMRKKYEKSFLPDLLPIALPENLEIDLFKKLDFKDFISSYAGEKYDAFLESVEVTDMDERRITIGGEQQTCRVYRITWSSKAATALLGSFGGDGLMANVVDLINGVFPEIEPDCQCYVDEEGNLVGLDFVSLGTQYVLLLSGEDNLWDEFSLTVTSLYGEPAEYYGSLRQDGSNMSLVLSGDAGTFCDIRYNDSTGDFSLNSEPLGLSLDGVAKTEGDWATFEISWVLNSTTQTVRLSMKELDEEPEKLAKNYTDLLDLSLTDWQRLLLDLGISLPGN